MRVLLVEDDPMLGEGIKQALNDAAMSVDHVTDGVAALAAAQVTEYTIVLLDLGLPKRDGIQVLGQLRAAGNKVPVIIITARDALESRLKGLDQGADDYLLKPFSIDELQARMRAVLRRHNDQATPMLIAENLKLDPASRSAVFNEILVELSAREFGLLHALMLRPGQILSREQLEERIYGWDDEVTSNAVEVIIHGLRKKLNRESIRNVRGLGWMVPKL
jgi:two-component system OmpR family response regulator